jgi:hypothetical protein
MHGADEVLHDTPKCYVFSGNDFSYLYLFDLVGKGNDNEWFYAR